MHSPFNRTRTWPRPVRLPADEGLPSNRAYLDMHNEEWKNDRKFSGLNRKQLSVRLLYIFVFFIRTGGTVCN